MPRLSLTRPIQILAADGSLETLAVRELSLGAGKVLVARERCRFDLFTAPPGLGGRAALNAARLHALAHAPYEQAGGCIGRRGGRFGIWWWDQGWVDQQLQRHGLAEGVQLLPEAAGQPEGRAWRIVRGGDGFEAQAWEEGFLTRSLWRRRPFDAESWAAFTAAEGGETVELPPSGALPYVASSPYARRLRPIRPVEELPVGLIATSVATLLIGVAAVLAGQALKLRQETAAVARELASVQGSGQAEQLRRLSGNARALQDLSMALNRPDPIAMVERAQQVLRPFGLKVTGEPSWSC